ncbi:MAG: hypothetical protein M3R15_10300 [Acidobacteriota bacterium]|nr:hypothetical protein [Acidobacteriota bacterium]
MATQTFEGTWEEIKQHENHLIGHRVRVTVLDEEKDDDEPNTNAEQTATVTPNYSMREALRRGEELLKDMPETSGERTQEFLRQARNGGMFGYDPVKGDYE